MVSCRFPQKNPSIDPGPVHHLDHPRVGRWAAPAALQELRLQQPQTPETAGHGAWGWELWGQPPQKMVGLEWNIPSRSGGHWGDYPILGHLQMASFMGKEHEYMG